MAGNVVSKTGATVRAQGVLYKEFVQSVFIYWIESWVVTGAMLKLLEGFNHWESMVTSFRYLGRLISEAEDDWPAVENNLSRARAFNSCDSSTVFGSLLNIFLEKLKFPWCSLRILWKICVFQPLFITIVQNSHFVSHGKSIFGLISNVHIWSVLVKS